MSDRVNPNEPTTKEGWRAVAYSRQKRNEELEAQLRFAHDTIQVCYADIHVHQGERLKNVETVMDLQAEVKSLKKELAELKGTSSVVALPPVPAPPATVVNIKTTTTVVPAQEALAAEDEVKRAQEERDAELARKFQKAEEFAFKAEQARKAEAQKKAQADLVNANAAKRRQALAEARTRENLQKARQAEEAAKEALATKARLDAKKQLKAEEEAQKRQDAETRRELLKKKHAEDEAARIERDRLLAIEKARQEKQADELRQAEDRLKAARERELLASAAKKAKREQEKKIQLSVQAEARRVQALRELEEKTRRKEQVRTEQAIITLDASFRRLNVSHVFVNLRKAVTDLEREENERRESEEEATLWKLEQERQQAKALPVDEARKARAEAKKARLALQKAGSLKKFKATCDEVFSTAHKEFFTASEWVESRIALHKEAVQCRLQADFAGTFVLKEVADGGHQLECVIQGATTIVSPVDHDTLMSISAWLDDPRLLEAILCFYPRLPELNEQLIKHDPSIKGLQQVFAARLMALVGAYEAITVKIDLDYGDTTVHDFIGFPKLTASIDLDGSGAKRMIISAAQYMEWFYRGYIHKLAGFDLPKRKGRSDPVGDYLWKQ